ncbi:hypothetical protein PMI41_02785 [Phyllobacterium sp. YR531]|nr:hypothetical protein PMI41_02785 [Phyllobacterium sp. YR531]
MGAAIAGDPPRAAGTRRRLKPSTSENEIGIPADTAGIMRSHVQ